MPDFPVHVQLPGRLVLVGFGSIGQGVLPLILRHIGIKPERITIVTADDSGKREAAEYGIKFVVNPLTRENYRSVLDPLLRRGDFLLNLSVDVSSIALIKFAHEKGALYLDTCIEPWPGGYTDPSISPARRTNYALREEALALAQRRTRMVRRRCSRTARIPGMVSHFVKQALLNLASDTRRRSRQPEHARAVGGARAQARVKVIHIAERDTQVANVPKRPGEFVNTWSVDGFVSEGSQPAELGWGTHEKTLPPRGNRYDFGPQCAIYMLQPGAGTRVRTWTPKAGPFHGFLITHGESISIPDYLSHRENGKVVYRPTVHYAYHPCNDAVLSVHEFAGRNWQLQERKRILNDEIIEGIDELGVLLAGHKKNAYWYGSQLSIEEARKLVPHNTATSLQVCVAVLSGMVWAMENPKAGRDRAGRDGFPPQSRDLHAVPRPGRRRVHRLDAARRARRAVRGRPRPQRSVAVQERARLTQRPAHQRSASWSASASISTMRISSISPKSRSRRSCAPATSRRRDHRGAREVLETANRAQLAGFVKERYSRLEAMLQMVDRPAVGSRARRIGSACSMRSHASARRARSVGERTARSRDHDRAGQPRSAARSRGVSRLLPIRASRTTRNTPAPDADRERWLAGAVATSAGAHARAAAARPG